MSDLRSSRRVESGKVQQSEELLSIRFLQFKIVFLQILIKLNTSNIVGYDTFYHTKGQFPGDDYNKKYGSEAKYLPGKLTAIDGKITQRL